MNTTQQLSTISPVYYNGPKRPTPPEQIITQIGESLEAVSDLTARVSTAQQNGINWLLAVLNNSSTNCLGL